MDVGGYVPSPENFDILHGNVRLRNDLLYVEYTTLDPTHSRTFHGSAMLVHFDIRCGL